MPNVLNRQQLWQQLRQQLWQQLWEQLWQLLHAWPSVTILQRSVPLNVPPIVNPFALLQQFVELTLSTVQQHLDKHHLLPDAPAHKEEHQMSFFLTEKQVIMIPYPTV